MSAALCSSCGADIVWAFTLPGRKRMPLDAERRPDDDELANVAVRRDHLGSVIARVLKAGERPEGNEWRARSHFATCPHARQHRRDRKVQRAREGAAGNVVPFPGRRRG